MEYIAIVLLAIIAFAAFKVYRNSRKIMRYLIDKDIERELQKAEAKIAKKLKK